MTQLIPLISALSIIIYSISMGLSLMIYGKTRKKPLLYVGMLMFTFLLSAVCTTTQGLLDHIGCTHTLSLAAMLAFNIAETYLMGRIIYGIFHKPMSTYFYIWLCAIIIINGLISLFPTTLFLWDFLSFNISILVLCIIYWDALLRESGTDRDGSSGRYNNIILIMAVCSISMLAYSLSNLSLFQKFPSQSLLDLYGILFHLIVAVWSIQFYREEYRMLTSQPIQHAFRVSADDLVPEPVELLPDTQEESIRSQYGLTDRESEILQLILLGKSNQEISDTLFITIGTVKSHVHSIFSKIEVSSRSQLISQIMRSELP